MKFLLLAAAAAVSLGINAAHADSGDGRQTANTLFAQRPGVVARADVPSVPAYARDAGQVQTKQAQNGHGTENFATPSSRSPWLFPPIGKYLDQQSRG